jgi:hypothetical protein
VGGAFDGRPVDFALGRFLFFPCSRCRRPFFGGARACGPAQPAPPPLGGGGGGVGDDEALVCGSCLAASQGGACAQHGRSAIEWK